MHVAGFAALLAFALQAPQPHTNGTAAAPNTATAVRVTQPPTIDGRDDDDVWKAAPRYGEFRTFEPTVDKDPRFATEFRAAYDAKNLYVFVRMFDPHPDSIMRALTRRDNRGPSDQIKVIVDSYHDRRSG
ncbi:MAG: sugar-binding protein, partial [Gemmatimonadaceae bacterium]|nr:sugar-binding protein [Gemmatimonadaceae bacterium]